MYIKSFGGQEGGSLKPLQTPPLAYGPVLYVDMHDQNLIDQHYPSLFSLLQGFSTVFDRVLYPIHPF